MNGRPPDYILKCRTKDGARTSRRLGAGWVNQNGNISIILDPFMALIEQPNLQIMLFPADRNQNEEA